VTDLDHLHAIRQRVPATAMFAFHTAAALHGFGITESAKIHVTVPAGTPVPQIRGIAAHQHLLAVPQATAVFGLPCVPPARCAIDLARILDRMDALAVLDAALRLLDVAALRAEAALHDGRRGIRQVRELLGLADGRAECRQESHLRLVMHDGKLPAPVPQHGVLDDAGWVRYRIGLAYEEERVGIEYGRRRLRVDRARHNWLSRHGWSMRYFTDDDLYRRTDFIVPAVREALRSRRPRRAW
jgi:hypothetical protein